MPSNKKAPGALSINTVKSRGKLGANWKETELQTLPDGKQLLVVQSPNIKLNADSKAGIVRKFVFGIQGNTITDGRIIEMFGTAAYIASHKNTLLENYNVNDLDDFSGAVIEYDINYNYLTSKVYEEGKIKNNAGAFIKQAKKIQKQDEDKATQSVKALEYYNCIDYYYVTYWNGIPYSSEYLYTQCNGSPDSNEVGGDPNPPGSGDSVVGVIV